jgi:hypothetical protein
MIDFKFSLILSLAAIAPLLLKFILALRIIAVLGIRIQIRKIRVFFGLLDPDPLARGTDPDPSIIKQKQ